MNWVTNDMQAGTSGQAKRLEAIKIKLTGEMAEKFDVYYRVHSQTYGWLDWACNGEASGTSGLAKRLEAIEIVLVEKEMCIRDRYGKGSVMKLGDQSANMGIDVVPTGSLSLDLALGLGGMPRGRIIEIYGPESSGKTTVALHVVAEVQKMGGIAGFIDAEHALDPTYAAHIGVDIDNLYISQPDNGCLLYTSRKSEAAYFWQFQSLSAGYSR